MERGIILLEIVSSYVPIFKGLIFEISAKELVLQICFVLTVKSSESYNQTEV